MQEFAKVCCNIVEDFYGSFFAHIFRQLAQHGRLTLQQLAQRCRLPLRQIKSGMATLIQLRLVQHHTNSEGVSTYQANSTNAYNIMRTGRLVELADWQLGSSAASIIEVLAALGHCTTHELENHVHCDKILAQSVDKGAFQALLRQLIRHNYITAVREAHYQPRHDARQDVENFLREGGILSTGTGKKFKDDADAKIDAELDQRLDGRLPAPNSTRDLGTGPLYDTTVVCINYSNLIVHIRNNRIADDAEKMFGRPVAQVARAACLQVEHASPQSLPMRLARDPSAAVQQLDISKLSADVSDFTGEGDIQRNRINGNNDHRTNGATDEDQIIKHHLAVLSEGSFTFLLQHEDDAKSWSLDKLKFNKYLWDKEMYRNISERLSEPTLRIVRMLADKGKLDEKAMQELGLLNARELRRCLAPLQTMGFLELQEVPKDPNRVPKNTFFLYFFDPERARKVFVERMYKAMARIYQQSHLERIKVASTLGKLDRFEVGSEVDMLSEAELQVFHRWQQKECWFTTEIYRLDDSISILRDI